MPASFFKTLSLGNEGNQVFKLQIREQLGANVGFGGYSWPSSFVMAALLASNQQAFARHSWQISSMVELGAGCGLAGLVYAKLVARARSNSSSPTVVLTDFAPNVLDNLINQVIINDMQSACSVGLLDWQDLETTSRILASSPTTSTCLLLGADVFYDPSLFDGLLRTVSLFTQKNTNTIFLTTYHERSSKRSLTPLLKRYGLKGIYIASGQEILDKLHDQDIQLTFDHAEDYEATESSLVSVFLFAICSTGYYDDFSSCALRCLVKELQESYQSGSR